MAAPLTFTLPFPPSLNNCYANGKRGRFRTERYDSWIARAGAEILRQRPKKIAGPVLLTYEFGEPDKRRRDLGNLEKAPTDLLVSHGIIAGDHGAVVREIKLRWNADLDGMRVTIEPQFAVANAIKLCALTPNSG